MHDIVVIMWLTLTINYSQDYLMFPQQTASTGTFETIVDNVCLGSWCLTGRCQPRAGSVDIVSYASADKQKVEAQLASTTRVRHVSILRFLQLVLQQPVHIL